MPTTNNQQPTPTQHKTQNTKHKTQNTKHKTQNTKHKTQNTRHKTQDTKLFFDRRLMKTNSVRFYVKALYTSSSRAHQKWREFPNTSWTEGMGPSTPVEQSLSRRESAKARAAAQANTEPHRRNHAARARPCNNSGTSRTFAAANPRRNEAVPSEKRPQPGGTHRSQPHCVASLHPPLSRGTPGSCRLPVVLLGRGAVRQRRPRASQFRTGSQHQGPYPARNHWFCSDPPTDSRSRVLHREPPASQCPATAHADLRWPRASRRTATPASACCGRRRRRRNKTGRTCGPKRAKRLIGKLTNGADASGPPWDLRRAPSASDKVGLNATRKLDSTKRDGDACHPTLGRVRICILGIWRDNNLPGQLFPGGATNPTSPRLSTLWLIACTLHHAPPRLSEWCRRCQGDEPSPFLWCLPNCPSVQPHATSKRSSTPDLLK